MKIGILTFHYSNHNFGAVLQTYAISKLIESFGHEVYVINYAPKPVKLKQKLLHQIAKILGFQFEIFRRKFIKTILKKTNDKNELKKLNNILDCIIVGSDQVWRYRKDFNNLTTYFLDFVNSDKLTISYAASFGVKEWHAEENINKKVKELLERFNAISIREKSGVEICKNIFDIESQQVLDPTLVVDKKYFEELTFKNPVIRKKYIAYMILDDDSAKEKFIKKVASDKNLKFVRIKGKKVSLRKNLFLYTNVNKWLSYVKNAELVITDSFHCTVFSIIFKKRFVCIANNTRGNTRLENLLSNINLESRFLKDINSINLDEVLKPIDFNKVEDNLVNERIQSLKFLNENLNQSAPLD